MLVKSLHQMKNLTLTLSNLCGKINKLFHQIYYESHTQTDLLTTNLKYQIYNNNYNESSRSTYKFGNKVAN